MTFASLPSRTTARATVAPVRRSVTVIVPPLGVPTIELQRGAALRTSGPPTRYRPLTSVVVPGLKNGSPRGGPGSAGTRHRCVAEAAAGAWLCAAAGV